MPMTTNLNPNNWQEAKITIENLLIALDVESAIDFIHKYRKNESTQKYFFVKHFLQEIKNIDTFDSFFECLIKDYVFLKEFNFFIVEFEQISLIQYSKLMVFLLESYCLHSDWSVYVNYVINLHKQRIAGTEPTQEQLAYGRKPDGAESFNYYTSPAKESCYADNVNAEQYFVSYMCNFLGVCTSRYLKTNHNEIIKQAIYILYAN
jgi:hypothetical protein